jgi:hypothetical protein
LKQRTGNALDDRSYVGSAVVLLLIRGSPKIPLAEKAYIDLLFKLSDCQDEV